MQQYLVAAILVFIIIAACTALFIEELLSSVIALGAVGFGCSIAYLLVGAPDLAITQIVVEVAALVILIRITIGVDLKLASRRTGRLRKAVSGVLLLVLVVFVGMALRGYPEFGSPVMARIPEAPSVTYIADGLEKTGSANLVTGILMDFRAYDTLGEATVIFAAFLGGLTLLRKKGRND